MGFNSGFKGLILSHNFEDKAFFKIDTSPLRVYFARFVLNDILKNRGKYKNYD